jgi:plasmid stabilization system protein ParE
MPQGDKSKYTDKQKRQAAAIENSYKRRGVSEAEAEKRAWATVNKRDGGGKKRGSARTRGAKKTSPKTRTRKTTTRSGSRAVAGHSANAKKTARSRAARKAAVTRARNRKQETSGFFRSLSSAVFGI